MMSVSDWISIICAGVALIVTVIIAVLQIRQSNRMERFEKRQDKGLIPNDNSEPFIWTLKIEYTGR